MAWYSSGNTNAELVDNLVENGLLSSGIVEAALRSVDRALFVPNGYESVAYEDRPLKEGNVHLSAPHIYCAVLENLELVPNSRHSFLNLGIGTGYLSCICSHIMGDKSQSFGVDIHSDVLNHCQAAISNWKESIDYTVATPVLYQGNGLELSNEGECRLGFDRIYVGASISTHDLKNIQGFLSPGGILVAPVEDRLMQVKRSSNKFVEKMITAVHFASMLKNPSQSVYIPASTWNVSTHHMYPDAFQSSVKELLLCSRSQYVQPAKKEPVGDVNLACVLPKEVWIHVLSFTHKRWFEPSPSAEEMLAAELSHEKDFRADAEEKNQDLARQNAALKNERNHYLQLIQKIRRDIANALVEQREAFLMQGVVPREDPLRDSSVELLHETQNILHIGRDYNLSMSFYEESEDERSTSDNSEMDIEEDDDMEDLDLNLTLSVSMEAGNNQNNRAERSTHRAVSFANGEL